MKLELNEQERIALIELLDIAVKMQGIKVAGAALYFVNKLNQKEEGKEDKKVIDKAN